MIYKVSYVVIGGGHPGAMINQEFPPEIGKEVQLGGKVFRIVEVSELLPPMGDFAFLHVTCRPIQASSQE
jgi:hypothetical protein